LIARTLLENFFLFFSLAMIQFSFLLANPHASLILALLFGCLGCAVMSVLRFLCHGLEWCLDKGILKESPQKTVTKTKS
jgi:hypothetical protein